MGFELKTQGTRRNAAGHFVQLPNDSGLMVMISVSFIYHKGSVHTYSRFVTTGIQIKLNINEERGGLTLVMKTF